MIDGFFTRQDAKEVRTRKRAARRGPSVETLHQLGTKGVRTMNRKARTPLMEPDRCEDPLVYVLGGAPTLVDDRNGFPFSDEDGEFLRESIPRWGRSVTMFDNACRTLPPKGRDPKPEELECFRPSVVESIEKAQPKVVIAVGKVALKWANGITQPIMARGRKYPVRFGKHECWMVPLLEPGWIIDNYEGRPFKVSGKEWLAQWQKDIEFAYQLADLDEPPVFVEEDEVKDGIEHVLSLSALQRAVKQLRKETRKRSSFDCLGCDIETHRFRFWHEGARLLSLAFSTPSKTYSIPLDHPEQSWGVDRKRVIELLRQVFLDSEVPVVFHNLPFDIEWLAMVLGKDLLTEANLGCSLQSGYVLNPGPPGDGAAGLSLDDLCLERFGLAAKSLAPAAQYVARLMEQPLAKVLDYNAYDARLACLLWSDLQRDVAADDGLEMSYRLQMERIPALVNAQIMGVPVDQGIRREMEKDFDSKLKQLEDAIRADPEVQEWEAANEAFSPTSTDHVGKLLGDQLRIPGVKKAKGYSTAANVIEAARDDHPIVDMILKHRGLSKLAGTYVRRFNPDHEESYVSSDGLVHCRYSVSKTRTFRLSSEDPNNQNWPKRKNKEVRKQLAAPKGWVFVAADQGQIEARVLAMESRDPTWVRMIGEDYDIHTEWAEKLAGIDDDFAALLEEKPKAARHQAKNGWVFPSFYGSSLRSIIETIGLEDENAAGALFEEFWRTFKGIKSWQQEQKRKYDRLGYVRSLTGRRRMGPLSWNMIINTPIQCAASDICVDAMVRCYRRSVEEEAPFLCPVLQIHDDLTFLVPESELGYAVPVIVEEQLNFNAPWVNVPLSVEVEVGPNLFDMEEIGTWTSKDLQ